MHKKRISDQSDWLLVNSNQGNNKTKGELVDGFNFESQHKEFEAKQYAALNETKTTNFW